MNTGPTAAVLAVQDPSHPILSCHIDYALDLAPHQMQHL